MKRSRQSRRFPPVCRDFSPQSQPFGCFQAQSCLGPPPKNLPGHPNIGQGKQGHELCGVLCQSAIANVAVAELAFDHPKGMLHLGAHTDLDFLGLLRERDTRGGTLLKLNDEYQHQRELRLSILCVGFILICRPRIPGTRRAVRST